MFITNGSVADVYVVMAVTDAATGRSGVSAFIVDRGTPGPQQRPQIEKLGLRASDTAEVIFDNVTVPARNLIGELGEGYRRRSRCSKAAGSESRDSPPESRAARFEEATAYAKERQSVRQARSPTSRRSSG